MMRSAQAAHSFNHLNVDTESLDHRFNRILETYNTLADSDPIKLRKLLPASEVWRLFVDGLDQPKGWLPYEKNEEGYLAAMYECFDTIYDFSATLNSDWVKKLHKTATNNVKNTNYDKEKRHPFVGDHATRIGNFRTDYPVDYSVGGCYFLTSHTQKTNATLDGIREFLLKTDRENSWHAISIRIQDDCSTTFEDLLISKPFLHSVRQRMTTNSSISDMNLVNSQIGFLHTDVAESLFTLSKSTIHDLGTALRLIGTSKNNDDLAQVIFELTNTNFSKTPGLAALFVSVQRENTPKQLNADVEFYISEYSLKMNNAPNPINKLRVIIELIQNLEQLHPFSDANCRTFCMTLLNYLLIKNGFPFAILTDPNRFDLFSREELLLEVISGMENTFELLKTKELFAYKVTNKDFENGYFRELTALEEKRRAQSDLHLEWKSAAFKLSLTPPSKVNASLFAKPKKSASPELKVVSMQEFIARYGK